MKLASRKNNHRDGELVIVDKTLTRCVVVSNVLQGAIASSLQDALENWAQVEPKLQKIYSELNANSGMGEPFNPDDCESPLPRSYQFLDGSVYLCHMIKARKARGAQMPPNYETEPLMYQGMSHRFIPPTGNLQIPSQDYNLDIEGEIAIVTDDVPMGVTPEEAKNHIKLVMLLNDYTMRALTKIELPKQFGFLQAKPTSGFSPVAVTTDELEDWDGETLNAELNCFINGKKIGAPNAGVDMYFNYPQLVSHAARTRELCAGTIIGAGTVANENHESGTACIAELRADETLEFGEAKTPFLSIGDTVQMEIFDKSGKTIFGRIDQTIVSQ